MSQHPSLRSKEKDKQHRSVLKRYERVRELKAKEKWEEGNSVFGLPKLKIIKFKVKKEKAAPATQEATAASGQTEEAKASAAPEAKQPAKEATKKDEKKK